MSSTSIHGVHRVYDHECPTLQGPAAWVVAANAPGNVRILVAPQRKRSGRNDAPPTPTEWAVAVTAGLAAAALIGAITALL